MDAKNGNGLQNYVNIFIFANKLYFCTEERQIIGFQMAKER